MTEAWFIGQDSTLSTPYLQYMVLSFAFSHFLFFIFTLSFFSSYDNDMYINFKLFDVQDGIK